MKQLLCVLLSLVWLFPSLGQSAEPVWPGSTTRFYPGIYPHVYSDNATDVGAELTAWWGGTNAFRAKYRELVGSQRATHLGISAIFHDAEIFSSFWYNSTTAPYNYGTLCNNSTVMRNPNAVVGGQSLYDWSFIDGILALPLVANGEVKVVFRHDDQDVSGASNKWFPSQGMLGGGGAQPKKYDWAYARFKMDLHAAFATRYGGNTKIAAVVFEEFAAVVDNGPTCGYIAPTQSMQVSAENGTFFYPAQAMLAIDPGLMVLKTGPAAYISGTQYFTGLGGTTLGLNDLVGIQGGHQPDMRFFNQNCGNSSTTPPGVDCTSGTMLWLMQQTLVRTDWPVWMEAQRHGWRNLFDGAPPNARRGGARNPWNVATWPANNGNWNGELSGGATGTNHQPLGFPDPMFWVWYTSGAPRAVGAARDSGLGQSGPDPAGVLPSVFYGPRLPYCVGWACAPADNTFAWNGNNMSIARFHKAFDVFGPRGTKAMFRFPAGYLESFGATPPSFLSATVNVADTTDVCFNFPDGLALLPATGAAGLTFKVDTVPKTPNGSVNRTGLNCYRAPFAGGTITTDAQEMKVSYSPGTITSGAAPPIPATAFTDEIALNRLPSATVPVLAMTRFQFYNFYGGLTTAVPYFGENITLQAPVNSAFLVWIKVTNTVAAAATEPLFPYVSINGAAYVPLPDTCAASPVAFADAPELTSEMPIADRKLTQDHATFVTGVVLESFGATTPIAWPTAPSETEYLIPIQICSTASLAQTFRLHLHRAGNIPFASYDDATTPFFSVVTSGSRVTGGREIGGMRRQ